jgi:hypothetical protein
MPNYSQTSTGERITDATIQARYSKMLRYRYEGCGRLKCEGCGEYATCTAHIIAKARLKQLHKAELIYDPKASFPACYKCNLAIENPKGEAWKELKNKEYCLEFIEIHDPELYQKFILN